MQLSGCSSHLTVLVEYLVSLSGYICSSSKTLIEEFPCSLSVYHWRWGKKICGGAWWMLVSCLHSKQVISGFLHVDKHLDCAIWVHTWSQHALQKQFSFSNLSSRIWICINLIMSKTIHHAWDNNETLKPLFLVRQRRCGRYFLFQQPTGM